MKMDLKLKTQRKRPRPHSPFRSPPSTWTRLFRKPASPASQTSCSPPNPDFKDSGPPRQKFSHQRGRGYPKSTSRLRRGRGMPREGGRWSEPPALPHRPLHGGLFGGWQAPPPRAGSGAPAPGPPRRLLPGAPAAVPETPARGRHPDFGAPGLPAASQACLGPGPGARTAPGKALTLHRAREALALVARVHGRRLGAEGGSPAGRGARARGARVYMVQGLFLLFFHPPPAFLLPTPRGGEDGCTASATSAA